MRHRHTRSLDSQFDISPPRDQSPVMRSTIEAPESWVESVGQLTLPKRADQRLQELMDRNNEGLLNQKEREELEAFVEWSEKVSLLRAQALRLLGRPPA